MKLRIEENNHGGYTLTAREYRSTVATLTSAVSEKHIYLHSTFGMDPAGVCVEFSNATPTDALNYMHGYLISNAQPYLPGRIAAGFTNSILGQLNKLRE